MPLFLRPTLPAAFRILAVLALAAGLGVWASILLAPKAGALPPAVSAQAPRAADNTPVALWFGKDEAMRTQITVLGVIAAGADGAAVLSIDGGPPLAELTSSSRMNAEWSFLLKLRDMGRTAGRRWLKRNYEAIGKSGTLDLREAIF